MQENNISEKRLLITQQEMVLIKNSDEVKKIDIYGNLFDCLEEYKKISKKDLVQNIVFDKKARTVLLNTKNKKLMMENILKEWYSMKDFDISDVKMSCQLCGRVNKYIFYIHNKITEVELHIGSDCVQKFPDITGISQQRKRLSQIRKEQDQQRRKIEFESLEGEEYEFILRADEKFKKFKIMLPFKLYTEIKDVLYQLNLVKSSYIKSGGNLQEIFARYTCLKRQFDECYNVAKSYYNRVKDSQLICDDITGQWILENDASIWKKVAVNGGFFDVDTLKKIYLSSYVNKKLPLIKEHLDDKDIKILQSVGNSIRFQVQNSKNVHPITFTMTMKKFMENIGCYCLTDKEYKFDKRNLEEISIENTRKNFTSLYNNASSMLNKKGYDFIVEDKTAQEYWKKLPYHEIKYSWSGHTHQVSAMYKKSDTALFLSAFSPTLLEEDDVLDKNFDKIVKKMECGKVWITQREKDINEQIAKEARGLQRQREFIPY